MLLGLDDSEAEDEDISFLKPKQVLLLFDDKRNDDVGISNQRTASARLLNQKIGPLLDEGDGKWPMKSKSHTNLQQESTVDEKIQNEDYS